MTWLYLHLITNHFPIILTIVGTAACIAGAARRRPGMWSYGIATLAIGGALAIPVWITGYQAHYVIEVRLGLPEGLVEPHEVLAEATTVWLMIPMSLLAGFAWWRARQETRRGPSPSWVRPAVLVVSILGSALISITAFEGAKISHSQPPRLSPADSAAAAQQNFQPMPPESLRVREQRESPSSR